MKRNSFITALLCAAVAWAASLSAYGAGQSSDTFQIVADVRAQHRPGIAVGSTRALASVSVGQRSVVGRHASATFDIPHGYQATTEGFDSDGDGVPDHLDPDTNGNGIPDHLDPNPYDFSGNGIPNVLDPDTDGDGYTDWQEWLSGTDPFDPSDYLRWLEIDKTGDVVHVKWRSKENQTYIIERTPMLAPTPAWTNAVSPVVATGTVMSVTDTNVTEQFIYRVWIP